MDDTAKTMNIRAVGGADKTIAPYDLVRKMRASILVLGPMLAKSKTDMCTPPHQQAG